VIDDPVDHGIIRNKSDDIHLSSALITNQRIDLVDFSYHLRPAPARDSRTLLLNEDEGMLIGLCLSHFPPVGVRIEAEISHSDGFGLKKPSRDPRGYAPLVAGRGPRRGGSEQSERWKGEVSFPSKETWPLSGI